MNNSKHYLVPALNNSKDYLVPASNNSKGYLVPALYNSSHNLVLATNDYNDTQPIHAMGSAAQRSWIHTLTCHTQTTRASPRRCIHVRCPAPPRRSPRHRFSIDIRYLLPRNPIGIARRGGLRFELLVAQRKIGRRCDFLEDVSEDVHFDWEFLGDVNFIKEIKFN